MEEALKNNDQRTKLVEYIVPLVKDGLDKKHIKERLAAVGWSEDDIDVAYGKALVDCGVPVPEGAKQATFTKNSSAMEVAMNIFSFLLLGIVASALVTLLFQVINRFLPDILNASYSYGSSQISAIHYSISALIIGFPVYWLTMRAWLRSFRSEEGKVELKITKFLTYLVLLITSVFILGDLIVVLFTFLQGEISARFFLKALVVVLVAGVIFSFYFFERRKVQYKKEVSQSFFSRFGFGVLGLVLVSIVLGFISTGSPAKERQRKFDSQRTNDLRTISGCLQSYADRYEMLPSNLNELSQKDLSYCGNKKDPETGEGYEYRVIVESTQVKDHREGTFELCANFALMSEGESRYDSDKWSSHGAGKACDRETVILGQPNSYLKD